MAKAAGVELLWLATGEGLKRNEPERDKHSIAEQSASYETAGPAFKISEDLTLTAKILESQTPYAIALRLNIRSFARALQAESRIDQIEQKLQTEISDLRQQITELQRQGKPQSKEDIKSQKKAM